MTSFSFEHPQVFFAALVLLPLLALAAIRSRAHNSAVGRITTLVMRVLWTAVCLIAAAGPVISRTTRQPIPARVYILQDESRSVADAGAESSALHQRLLEAIGAGPQTVDFQFAQRPWRPSDQPADTSQTDIEAALNHVNMQSLGAPDVKVVVISDGRSTRGDAIEAANRLALRGAVVHTMPIGVHHSLDTRIVRAEPPSDAHVGIAAATRVTVASEKPARAQVRLVDPDGNVIDQRTLPVQGEQTLVLHFTPKKPGVEVYSVRVDVLPSANSPAAIADTKPLSVYVLGPPRLLICDNFPGEMAALCKAMEPLKVPIDLITPDKWPADLSAYAGIVISDWSGKELTEKQRGELRQFVEEQGGGLVFIGGDNVLPSRWKQNSIAQMLPVTLHDKPAQLVRKLGDASVVYVVDRSGSMNEILGGTTPVSKMEMVKTAIITSIGALPEHTQVGVVSFDAVPEVLVPPTDVAQKQEITRLVSTLQPRGGTRIEPAIRQGMAMLATMPGRKYIIVLTDGIGERPSTDVVYWGAVSDDAKRAHLSWTSVAVGRDADQTLLSYLALETRGKYYYCDTGDKIPKVFLEQAQSMKRIQQQSEKSFQPQAGPAATRLKDVTPAEMPELDGKIRSSAREHVDVVLLGQGNEPLLASWQFGLGRVVAFTSDAKGLWARQWVGWKGYSPFWLQTVQEVMRVNPALHARVRGRVAGNRAIFHFKVTDQQGNAADNLKTTGEITPTGAAALSANRPELAPVQWQQTGPGEYEASADVPADGQNYQMLLTLERDGTRRTRYSAIVTGRRDPEMAETGPDLPALRAIAEAGHGLCTADVEAIAAECRQTQTREVVKKTPLWKVLVIAALLLWPLDIAARKFL